jgi:hypothetical protein
MAGSLVIRVSAPPAADTTQMSTFPPRSEANAIRLPSGDHEGAESSSGAVVIGVAIPPATGTVQMSLFPLRLELNAIRLPSGDQEG